MVGTIQFFTDYVVLIYLILFIALIFTLRRFYQTRRELGGAVFGLEVDIARRNQARASAILVGIGILALAEFVLVVYLVPSLPGLTTLYTPTNDLAAPVSATLPAEILATRNALTPSVDVPSGLIGCIPGQIMITSPEPGEQIRGKIMLMGTADIPNFGFYKYEFSPSGVEDWMTIQAGRELKSEESLGEWDTSEIPPGDYLLRLVVVDNQGQAMPACIVSVRILIP
jgi:hypothetical protein